MADAMTTGTIIKIVRDKGFGFIKGSDTVEYFFHRTAAPDFERLQEGGAVRFLATRPTKRPRAESVQAV